jgi:plastocyanin
MFPRSLVLCAGMSLFLGFSIPAQAQTAFNVTNNGMTSYTINAQSNPTLNLARGQTYTFQVNAIGHPFWIKSVQGTGAGNAFNTGITNNGTQSGTITFTVPEVAPSTLFYNCEFHPGMTGRINVSSVTPVLPVSWGALKARYYAAILSALAVTRELR